MGQLDNTCNVIRQLNKWLKSDYLIWVIRSGYRYLSTINVIKASSCRIIKQVRVFHVEKNQWRNDFGHDLSLRVLPHIKEIATKYWWARAHWSLHLWLRPEPVLQSAVYDVVGKVHANLHNSKTVCFHIPFGQWSR